MIILPTFQTSSPRYKYHISLDGIIYYLNFNWNTRESAWYMDIANSSETLILAGIKLVPDYRLLKQYKAIEGLPAGDFLLVDSKQDDQNSQVTFDNFGDRYVLMYVEESDLGSAGVL